MSGWDEARKAVHMVDVAVKAMEQLQKITKLGGSSAATVLAVIDAGLSAIADGFAGKTEPSIVAADIDAAIKSLNDQLAANDAAVDAEFDKGGTTP